MTEKTVVEDIVKPEATDKPTATPDDLKPIMRPDGIEYIVRCWETTSPGIYQVHVNGLHIDNIRQLAGGNWLARGGFQSTLKDHAMMSCVTTFTGLPAAKLAYKWSFILV